MATLKDAKIVIKTTELESWVDQLSEISDWIEGTGWSISKKLAEEVDKSLIAEFEKAVKGEKSIMGYTDPDKTYKFTKDEKGRIERITERNFKEENSNQQMIASSAVFNSAFSSAFGISTSLRPEPEYVSPVTNFTFSLNEENVKAVKVLGEATSEELEEALNLIRSRKKQQKNRIKEKLTRDLDI